MAMPTCSRTTISIADDKHYDMGFEENVVALYKPESNDPYATFEYKKVYIATAESAKIQILISEFFQKPAKDTKALQACCFTLRVLKVDLYGYDQLRILVKKL